MSTMINIPIENIEKFFLSDKIYSPPIILKLLQLSSDFEVRNQLATEELKLFMSSYISELDKYSVLPLDAESKVCEAIRYAKKDKVYSIFDYGYGVLIFNTIAARFYVNVRPNDGIKDFSLLSATQSAELPKLHAEWLRLLKKYFI